MVSKVQSYYKYNYREQLDFRYRLYLLSKEKDFAKRLDIVEQLTWKALTRGIGYYTCYELEKPFLELADKIKMPIGIQAKPKSFLHVMTQAYTTGGHTRVVERWIDSSPKEQIHSVVLLEQKDRLYPETLKSYTEEHNGNLYVYDTTDLVERATKLRELALEYQYIILHIHMHDPTAIVAFGNESFARPVLLFNHADHCYWCGSSIVDMLADLRDNDFAKKRGIKKHYTLRIPFDPNPIINNYPKSQKQSRIDLGLPIDKKIILTVGGAHKFQPFSGYEFCDIVNKAIDSIDNVICYGIGVDESVGNWGKYGSKFVAKGSVDYGSVLFDYINACDLYINSIPVGGGTAMLDAVQFKKPILSYSIFNSKLGDIVKGVDTIHNESVFVEKIQQILQDESFAISFGNNQYKTVVANHGTNVWQNNIAEMIKETPIKHKVNSKFYKVRQRIDDDSILVSLFHNSITKKTINIYDIYHWLKSLFYKG
jgi:hypothetical protein